MNALKSILRETGSVAVVLLWLAIALTACTWGIFQVVFLWVAANPLLSLGTAAFSAYSALALHALGHFVVAKISGMSIGWIHFWPFRFVTGSGGVDVRIESAFLFDHGDVWAIAGPDFSKRGWAFYFLAGPAANAVATLLFAAGALFMHQPEAKPIAAEDVPHFLVVEDWIRARPQRVRAAPEPDFRLERWIQQQGPAKLQSACFSLLAVANFLQFLGGVWPSVLSAATVDPSDVTLAVSFWRGGAFANRFLCNQQVVQAYFSGVRPRDCAPETVEVSLEYPATGSEEVLRWLCAYYHALDCGSIDRAAFLLDKLLEFIALVSTEHNFDVLAEGAYFEARFRKSSFSARTILGRIPSNRTRLPSCLRAAAAIDAREHQWKEAIETIDRAHHAAGGSLNVGLKIAEQAWLAEMRRECEQALAEEEGNRRDKIETPSDAIAATDHAPFPDDV